MSVETATGQLVLEVNVGSKYFRWAYRFFAYFGLMAVFGSLLLGFRHEPAASASNYGKNLFLYAAFLVPHLVMTRPWFKRSVWGNPAGSLRERQVYIAVAVVSWLAVLVLQYQWPLPGGELDLPAAVRFGGYIGFLYGFFLFFQGATTKLLDGLLGVPGALMNFSHGPETPLFTDGPYAGVRHPMYRAAVLAGLASLLIHPNLGQLLWALLIAATFIGFIPVEEAQLIRARGEDYRRYRERTPYRLFRGIW